MVRSSQESHDGGQNEARGCCPEGTGFPQERLTKNREIHPLAQGVFRGLMQRGTSEPGEAKAAAKVLGDFPHEMIEGSLADQEVCRPLVLPALTQRDSADAEPVRPSDTADGQGGATLKRNAVIGARLSVERCAFCLGLRRQLSARCGRLRHWG